MASWSARWGSLVAVALFAGLAVWGVVLVRRAPPAPGLADTRVVAVRDATAAAGHGTPVRLQGTLVGLPALVAPGGKEYALQILEITLDGSGRDTPDPVTDYRRLLPPQLFLSDGDSVVAVDPTDLDVSFVPLVATGTTGRDGRLPADVVAAVAPDFTDLPGRADAVVTVRGIEAGVPVVAHGTLVLQEGVPSLVRPANGDPFILTTMSFPEVQRVLRSRDRLDRLYGWGLVVVGALGMVLAVVGRRVWRPLRAEYLDPAP